MEGGAVLNKADSDNSSEEMKSGDVRVVEEKQSTVPIIVNDSKPFNPNKTLVLKHQKVS